MSNFQIHFWVIAGEYALPLYSSITQKRRIL